MYKLQQDEIAEMTEIINKLNKLTFNKKDGNRFISEEGFEFTWEFNLGSRIMPVQLAIAVWYNKSRVTSWGCSGHEDTFEFAKFIVLTEGNVRDVKYDLHDLNQKRGLDMFNNL